MHLPGSRARSEPRPPPSPSPPALALTVTLTLSRVALTLAPTLPLNPEPDRRQATTGAHQRRSKRRCRHPGALGSALPSSLPSALPSALSSSLPSSPPSTRPSGARSAARTGSRQRSGSVGCNERARGLWRSELGLCPRGTLGVGGRGGRGGYRRGWRLVMRLQRAVEAALVRLLAAACSVELHGRFRLQDRVRASVALRRTMSESFSSCPLKLPPPPSPTARALPSRSVPPRPLQSSFVL